MTADGVHEICLMASVAFLRQLRCPPEHRDCDNLTSRLLAEADFAE